MGHLLTIIFSVSALAANAGPLDKIKSMIKPTDAKAAMPESEEAKVEAIVAAVEKLQGIKSAKPSMVFVEAKESDSDGGMKITQSEWDLIVKSIEEAGGKVEVVAKKSIERKTSSSNPFFSKLEEIKKESTGKGWEIDGAKQCMMLASLYESYGNTMPVPYLNKTIETVTSLTAPRFEDMTHEQMGLEHLLLQKCRFLTNNPIAGWCPGCKGLSRLGVEIFVKQKINKAVYLAHTMVMASGKVPVSVPSDKMISVVSGYSGTGRTFLFGVHAGTEEYQMLNGFKKKLPIIFDIGSKGVSAVLCRFRQLEKFLDKDHTCGWRVPKVGGFESGWAGVVCVPNNMFNEDKTIKGNGNVVQRFDYSCNGI